MTDIITCIIIATLVKKTGKLSLNVLGFVNLETRQTSTSVSHLMYFELLCHHLHL